MERTLMHYNAYNPSHYVGRYGVLRLTEEEARAYCDFRLSRVGEAEKVVLSAGNISKHSLTEDQQHRFRAHYESVRQKIREEFLKMRDLGFVIFSGIDYYMERYFLLREYRDVGFALGGAFGARNDVMGVAVDMLAFIRDAASRKLLQTYLSQHNKESENE